MVTDERSEMSKRMQETDCYPRFAPNDATERLHVYDWLIHNPAPVTLGSGISRPGVLVPDILHGATVQAKVILVGACKYCGFMIATDMDVPS